MIRRSPRSRPLVDELEGRNLLSTLSVGNLLVVTLPTIPIVEAPAISAGPVSFDPAPTGQAASVTITVPETTPLVQVVEPVVTEALDQLLADNGPVTPVIDSLPPEVQGPVNDVIETVADTGRDVLTEVRPVLPPPVQPVVDIIDDTASQVPGTQPPAEPTTPAPVEPPTTVQPPTIGLPPGPLPPPRVEVPTNPTVVPLDPNVQTPQPTIDGRVLTVSGVLTDGEGTLTATTVPAALLPDDLVEPQVTTEPGVIDTTGALGATNPEQPQAQPGGFDVPAVPNAGAAAPPRDVGEQLGLTVSALLADPLGALAAMFLALGVWMHRRGRKRPDVVQEAPRLPAEQPV